MKKRKAQSFVFSKVVLLILLILFILFILIWYTQLRDEMVNIVNEYFNF